MLNRPDRRHSALFIAEGGLISARVMRAWLGQGHVIAALWIGQSDERRFLKSRRLVRKLAPSWSVAALARRLGIPIRSHPRLSKWTDAAQEAARTEADVLITCTTLQIVPPAMLRLFGVRAFNFHPALLPRYRGPAPLTGMVLDGRAHDCSGVTLHLLTPGIDEGDIVGQRAVPFRTGGSFERWSIDLAEAAADLTAHELAACLSGRLQPQPQDARDASYRRIGPGELVIDATTTAERARWLSTTFRGTTYVRLCTEEGRTCAVRRLKRVAPLTAGPPVVTGERVEMDLFDARVVFERKTRKSKRQDERRLLARLAFHKLGRLFSFGQRARNWQDS